MRARPIIVPHFGQKGRLVAIEAGVASWNLNMPDLFTVIRPLRSTVSRILHEIYSIDTRHAEVSEKI